MVFLSKIYTKVGDGGRTMLGDGSMVPKHSVRVAAYGEVDELNSALGLALATVPDMAEAELVQRIQNELFDVGADLCVPLPDADGPPKLRITPEQISYIEDTIDRVNGPMPPLTSFILPGGSLAAGWLHLTRAVCRRAERAVTLLIESEPDGVNANALIYLNRLSDLLFVLARSANRGGEGDELWVPGRTR